MKNQIVVNILCILILTSVLSLMGNFTLEENNPTYNKLNGSWIEKYDYFTLLYLNGSHYEMGYQHGYLLKNEIVQNLRAFLIYTDQFGWNYSFYVWLWNEIKDYVPTIYKDEMRGIADGSGLSFLNISIGNIMVDWFHCCEAAAWGPATSDGKLIHMRSFDWSMEMIDPITETNLRENQIFMIRNPENGYASIEPSFSGLIGGPGGINENGIGIGILCSYCFDEINSTHAEGIPVTFRIKMVLDQAFNSSEGLAIINSNKTCGYNFIISDKDVAYAVEQTLTSSYYGKWDDSVESTRPFWLIDHVVRRTNIFINPDLSAVQRDCYNPSFFPILNLFFKKNPVGYKSNFLSSTSWLHYRTLSKEIEKLWSCIELNNSIDMLRNIYLGKTGFRFFIVQRIGTYIPLHQWVACPETGDILISFASVEKNAHENPVYYFNLFELLSYKPS
jgi:hypothetical protein